jgi:hypothetical protein
VTKADLEALKADPARLTRKHALALTEALLAAWEAAERPSPDPDEQRCASCGSMMNSSSFRLGYKTSQRVLIAAVMEVPL